MQRLIAFVGNPNVGKSVIFNKITGQYAVVSNYSGTTVDVTRGNIHIAGEQYQIVDTPGVYSLMPLSEDEQVTRDLIIREKPNIIVQVCDMKNIERSLHLFFELSLFNIPMVFVLNMHDEAVQSGIRINIRELEKILNVPVVVCTATTGSGIKDIIKNIPLAKVSNFSIKYKYSEDIECVNNSLKEKLNFSKAITIYLLSGDKGIYQYIPENMKPFVSEFCAKTIKNEFKMFAAQIFNDNNNAVIDIVNEVKKVKKIAQKNFLEFLGNLCVNPFAGSLIMLVVIFLMYEFIGVFVAGTVVDYIQTKIFGDIINPFIASIFDYYNVGFFIKDFFVGKYGFFTMALPYAFAIIFPIVIAFFLFFGILEDSGYLPRLSVILNKLFSLVGLNGKAVLPMVLGLGCGTMAVLSSRILETKKERMIVLILLSLAIPCSAQLGIILAMLSAVSYKVTIIWLSCVLFSFFLVGKILEYYLKGESTPFIIEIPKMRIPSIINILAKVKMRLEWYMKEVVPLFILATAGLFFIDKIHLLGKLEKIFSPIVVHFLGLPIETTSTFIMGFLRRDYGASGIYDLAQHGMLTSQQILISSVVITLFVPCLAQSLMVIKEHSIKIAALIFCAITAYAVLFGGVLRFIISKTAGL
ncbi:MAG: ferrous iron transport protein B [Endomicrobiaceae bacterium]